MEHPYIHLDIWETGRCENFFLEQLFLLRPQKLCFHLSGFSDLIDFCLVVVSVDHCEIGILIFDLFFFNR